MILVTGSTGTVGSEVVKQLVEKGVRPRALVRNEEKSRLVSSMGADAAIGDLQDPGSLDKAMEGIDHLFLLSPSGPEQPSKESNAVDAAKRAGVEHIVKLSVIGASPTSDINLVRWHWQSEKYIEESGIGFTHIRPTLFMQNIIWMAQTIISENRIYVAAGDGKASFIDARDIAATAVAALTEAGHMNRVYEITGPEALSHYDVATKLSAALGRRIEYIDTPRDTARQVGQDLGLSGWQLDDSLLYYDYVKSGDLEPVTHWVGRVAGKQPHMFDAFVCDYADVFQREYKAAS